VHLPILLSLGVIIFVLVTSAVLSVRKLRREERAA
jgi:hypothetical protein